MSNHVEQGSRAVEGAMAAVTGATVLGLLHWALAVPAALYYALKCWDWWKARKTKAEE